MVMSLRAAKGPGDILICAALVSVTFKLVSLLLEFDGMIPESFSKEMLRKSFKRRARGYDVPLDANRVRLDHRTVRA